MVSHLRVLIVVYDRVHALPVTSATKGATGVTGWPYDETIEKPCRVKLLSSNLCPGGHEETMMSNRDFRDGPTADDQNRIERQLAELPERRQLEIVCRDVKTLADAAIGRASQAARLRRNDTYPGEWDCGGV